MAAYNQATNFCPLLGHSASSTLEEHSKPGKPDTKEVLYDRTLEQSVYNMSLQFGRRDGVECVGSGTVWRV